MYGADAGSAAENHFPELRRIIDHMQSASPRVLAERASLAAASADRAARGSARLPRVDLEANLAHREEFRDQFPKRQTTTRPLGFAAIRQPLYHWGALDAERDIGKINEAIQQGRYEDATRLLVNQARRTYLEFLVTRDQLLQEDRALRVRGEIRDLEQGRLKLGEITADQAEQADLDYQEARLQRERINHHLLNLEADLRRITGWQGALSGPDEDFDAILTGILRQQDKRLQPYHIDSIPPPSSDYRIKQQQIERESHNYTIISARTRPLLNLVGNIIQDQVESVGANDANRTLVQVMLQVRWNIFDGFDTRYRKLESLARRRSLHHEAELIRTQHLNEAQRLLREHNLQRRDIDLMELRRDLRQRELQRARKNYENGEISTADLEQIRRANSDIAVSLRYARVRQIDLNQRLSDIFTGETSP